MMDPNLYFIESTVRKYFYVYETKLFPEYVEFKVVLPDDKKQVEENFRSLWNELKKQNFAPTLQSLKSEYVIQVFRLPEERFHRVHLNIIFLIATLITTTIAGAINYAGYFNLNPYTFHSFLMGAVTFALPLLAILGLHELGHYFAAKRHNVKASLPFFIPAPPMIGTLGAFISLREPIPDRKALLDIGFSGPIVGFLVAIPVAIIGNYLSIIYPPVPQDTTVVTYIQLPLFYELLNLFIPIRNVYPTVLAAWVGFIVTAINLFPIGQLDGGHIARAILGERSKYLGYIFLAILLILGIFYIGWLLFALLVLILGLRHPPSLNEVTKVGKKGYVVGIVALLLVVGTFTPIPITQVTLTENFSVSSYYNNTLVIGSINETSGYIIVKNTGEKMLNLTVNYTTNDNLGIKIKNYVSDLPVNSVRRLNFTVYVLPDTMPEQKASITVYLKSNLTGITNYTKINLIVYSLSKELIWMPSNVTVYSPYLNATLINMGNETINVSVPASNNQYNVIYNATIFNNMILLNPGQSVKFTFIFKNYGSYVIIAHYYLQAAVLSVNYV